MKSGINPFDSQEAKPYKNDPEILAMTNLVVSYQNNDINEFESILRNNRNNIMADPFIKEHIEGIFIFLEQAKEILNKRDSLPQSDLLRNIRTQVLIKLIRPYTRIAIPFISNELNIEPAEVESLLVSCILDNTIRGRIDQINQVLELEKESRTAMRYSAMEKWSNQIQSLQLAVINKMAWVYIFRQQLRK